MPVLEFEPPTDPPKIFCAGCTLPCSEATTLDLQQTSTEAKIYEIPCAADTLDAQTQEQLAAASRETAQLAARYAG